MAGSGIKIMGQNKKARHLYEFLDTYEAGLALTGSEVKSLRAGKISFMDGYVRFWRRSAGPNQKGVPPGYPGR